MIIIQLPSEPDLNLEHLVLDYNGTLAADGELLKDVPEYIIKISRSLTVHVVTGDTFGHSENRLANLPVRFNRLASTNQSQAKYDYIQVLGLEKTVCIGNGFNDYLMLEKAALGLAVIGPEGASGKSLQAADIIVNHITDAFELLLNPLRITATLRK